jgi:Mg2+ and Co2+ transporter CorA
MLEEQDHSAPSSGVINCAAYADGRRVADLPLSEVRMALNQQDRFVWIGLFEPHADVLRLVQKEFGLQHSKRLAAWAAIIAVPTMIAGVYGMNFDTMPELHWPLGYPLVMALMIGACASLFVGFRRSGWL